MAKKKIPRTAGDRNRHSPNHAYMTKQGRNHLMGKIDDRNAEEVLWQLLQISIWEWSQGEKPSLGDTFIKGAVSELLKRAPVLQTMQDNGISTLEELENLEFISDWIQESSVEQKN